MQRCLTVPHISSQAIPHKLNKKFDKEKASGKLWRKMWRDCGNKIFNAFYT